MASERRLAIHGKGLPKTHTASSLAGACAMSGALPSNCALAPVLFMWCIVFLCCIIRKYHERGGAPTAGAQSSRSDSKVRLYTAHRTVQRPNRDGALRAAQRPERTYLGAHRGRGARGPGARPGGRTCYYMGPPRVQSDATLHRRDMNDGLTRAQSGAAHSNPSHSDDGLAAL